MMQATCGGRNSPEERDPFRTVGPPLASAAAAVLTAARPPRPRDGSKLAAERFRLDRRRKIWHSHRETRRWAFIPADVLLPRIDR